MNCPAIPQGRTRDKNIACNVCSFCILTRHYKCSGYVSKVVTYFQISGQNFTSVFHLHRYRWVRECAQSNHLWCPRCVIDRANFLRKSALFCCVLPKELEFIMLDCSVVIVNSFFGFSLYLKENSVAIPKTDDVNVRRFPCKVAIIFARIYLILDSIGRF